MNQAEWENFLTSHPEANFLQSWQWGELHSRLGDTVVRRHTWQGIVKDARRGRYLEIPGGPLIDWTDLDTVSSVFDEIRRIALEQRCVFVRIRPQVLSSDDMTRRLHGEGLRKSPMHLHAEHTNILSLEQSESDILTGMRRQTRYEVRRALKLDMQVTWSNDGRAFDEFFEVQRQTAKRQGFIPPSHTFLHALRESFGDNARIYRVEHEGILRNLALVLWSGTEADYLEAASTPESRSVPGAYALQWQSIRDAKQAGLSRYNFWGIAYTDDPHHRYAGVTTFKRGFGGNDTTYIAAHDLVLHRGRYMLNLIVETARKKKRKL